MPSFRWFLLFLTISLQNSNAAEDKCTITNPLIKLANSCYGGDMSSVESEGKFTGSLDSSGVNYCYNTLLFASSQAGKNKIVALYENANQQLRMQTYEVTAKDIADAAHPTVLLSGLEGRCFARSFKNKECSGGLFGIGNTNLPTAVAFEFGATGYTLKGITRDRGQVKQAKSLAGSVDMDAISTNMRLRMDIIARIRKRTDSLLADKRKPAEIAAEIRDYRNCVEQFNNYLVINKLPDTYTQDDQVKLGRVLDKLGLRGTSAPSAAGQREVEASSTFVQ